MSSTESDLLEALVADFDFKTLESLTNEYNIFEALNVVRSEKHHSNFLAFLFNPMSKHGLGDTFLRHFLNKLELDSIPSDLLQVVVERETDFIDLLIYDKERKFACIIENKIDSGEHSDQLSRYYLSIRQRFPDIEPIKLFLTPDGIPTQQENSGYIPVSYTIVVTVLEEILNTHSASLGVDIVVTIRHYIQILRRHIVTNPKIRDFCRKIYSQHQKAIDLIIEYMPSDREKIQACLEEKIKSTKGIVLEHSTQSYISFSPESWTQIDLFNHAEGWMHSKHGLIFNIRNDVDSIVISLRIGPLPKEDRDYLYNLIQESDLFRDRNKHSEQFTSIARFKIMGDSEATGRTLEAIYKVIDTQWNIFLQDFLPPIEAFIIENLG